GDIGEICVEGAPVMVGYWNDSDLTERRQIAGRAGTWRTGDLGYRGQDGLLRLAGRRDQMVKIRGHRFDLGEVETVLRGQAGVYDAFAVLAQDGIRAAVLAESSDELNAALRLLCARRLPVFARPTRLLFLREFPTLPTGKLDRMGLRAR